jgi:hypothetical protein
MNNKLLLANSITLLYRESQIKEKIENSAPLVRTILEGIKLPEINLGVGYEREILNGLKSTALHMCSMPVDHVYEPMEMQQRIKLNCEGDSSLYSAISDGITGDLSEEGLLRTVFNLKNTLKTHFNEEKAKEIINKASYQMNFSPEKVPNFKKYIATLIHDLEPYQVDILKKDPAIISDIDTSDMGAMTSMFDSVQKADNGATILRTGWQGVNRMLDGGLRRGEETVVGALQHNYKTGFSLTVFKQVALYNVPILTNQNKKPLLLRISFEDKLELNLQFLYQSLYENEYKKRAVLKDVSPEEMSRYIKERLSVTGYHTRFMYVNPSEWTYNDVCNKILELEAAGYEIHLCMLDYLLKLPTDGCNKGSAGEDIRNMYERIRNFMAARNIHVFTPHQLSTEAKQLVRNGNTDFVKLIVGGGYYAGCKQIDQVVDLEIFIHIERVNGSAYLTVQRGKHRKVEQTPDDYLYCVLPFNGKGGIMDDINGPDTTRKRPGGGPIGSGEETPFWEVEI